MNWENSHVRHKLSKVLWIPVEGSRDIPLRERHIGQPILWQPSAEQEHQLRQDWEELMDYIVLGKLNQITAHIGKVMQLRPKGANSKAITKGIGKNGDVIDTLPLGFLFTERIYGRHFKTLFLIIKMGDSSPIFFISLSSEKHGKNPPNFVKSRHKK